MRPIRVIVAEPQPLFRKGLLAQLSEPDDIDVVGATGSGIEAAELINTLHPDIAVIAIRLPDLSGLDVLSRIASATTVIFLTGEESPQVICDALVLGARGYLLKMNEIDMVRAIRQVKNGDVVMCQESLRLLVLALTNRVEPGITGTTVIELSNRETQVLRLIGDGHSQKTVARLLGVSDTTVRTHCRNLYVKLGVHSQAAAIRAAMRLGLLDEGRVAVALPRSR